MAEDPTQEERIRAWLEAHLGPILSIERQPRWRPAWFIDVDRNGSVLPLYVRADRVSMDDTIPVRLEGQILGILEAEGIPVPHIYGTIEDADAVVMDRLPGRANLATADDDAERASVMDHYMDILARIHAIDPAAFAPLGLRAPDDADALALVNFERFVARYRAGKRRPEPLLEFGIAWLRRNRPTHRRDPRFVLGDPAQFMFENGRVTGVIDVELAHIGDVAHDLSGLRLRNIPEPLGDIGRALRQYERVSGQPIDVGAIEFHTAQFGLSTSLSLVAALHKPPAVPEIVQYLEWFNQYALSAIEAIASLAKVTLPDVDLPPSSPPRHADIAAGLPETISGLPASDPIEHYRRNTTATVARFVQRVADHGPSIEAADLDDIATLTGERMADWRAGDEALERFVLAAGPDQDEALIALFYRRVMRQMRLLEPVLNRTSRIEHIEPLSELLA